MTSAEYVGAIVVSAILVAAVILAVSPQGANVRAEVCRAVGSVLQTDLGCGSGGDGDNAEQPVTDEDYQPPACNVSTTGQSYNSVVSLGIVDIGENASLVRTVMSDGTVTLTATDGGMLGLSGAVGADAKGGNMDIGASIDFGGGVTFTAGDSWTFPDGDAADEFESLLNDHRMRDLAYRESGTGGLLADVFDPLDPLPLPTTTTSQIGLTADVSGQIGIDLTGNSDGSGPSVQMQAIAGSIDPEATWTQTTNTQGTESGEDDSHTYTVDVSIDSDVSSDIWATDLGLDGMAGMSLAITENAQGQITQVEIVTTNEGAINDGVGLEAGGSDGPGDDASSGSASFVSSSEASTATVTTTTLALDPEAPGYDDDLAVVRGWLSGTSGSNGQGYEWPGLIPMSAVNPALPGDDPFSQLMHERATVSAVTSEGVTDTTGLAAQVSLGLKLGLDFSMTSSEAEAVYAAYLGAPSNGERSMLPHDDCFQ